MKSYKSKKVKIAVSVIAVMLLVCMLAVTMTGCKSSEVGVTPTTVFFVGNFQKNVADADAIASLMAEGTRLVSVKEMLDAEGWTYNGDHQFDVIAGIYALAVTNYNNVTRSGYMIMTDASVNARNCANLGGKDVNVGIRSTYSTFTSPKGKYEQTISGVTVLDGLGGFVEQLKSNFGWNVINYSDEKIAASRGGFNAGAEFYGAGNNEKDVLKYIMGANNPDLNKETKKVTVSKKDAQIVPTETEPFESKREHAWSKLDRITSKDANGDDITLNVAGTDYKLGTYGTSWATSDFSDADYFDKSATTIDYDEGLDLYTLKIKLHPDYVDTASDFTKGALVKDTKDYIELTEAKYTKSEAWIEVYGSGLIKSMQKIDTLGSDKSCKLSVAGGMFGSCKSGGSASNRITYAFSYDESDCDPLKYVALYWPELGTDAPFKKSKIKDTAGLIPDLSKYDTFENYKPKANDMAGKFKELYSLDWDTYKTKK